MTAKKVISLYWKYQLTGWSLASLFWNFNAYRDGGFNVGIAIVHFVFDIAIGLAVTHAYRWFAINRRWLWLHLNQLPARLLPAIAITSFIYMVLELAKNYLVRVSLNEDFHQPFTAFTSENWWVLFTTGARIMAIWILAFHLYHYALWQIQTTKENSRLQVLAKDSALNHLATQLNPHFFFNSLNTIKSLIADDTDKARRSVDLLSELLRTSLYKTDDSLIPLKVELGLVNDYFELEKIRFENRLHYQVYNSKDTCDCLVPPLSIQALAENAVKHGIGNRSGGGVINIWINISGTGITIIVQNPGMLDINAGQAGLGLKNLRERLLLQYNDKASLALSQLPGETVEAIMKIPCK